MHVAQYDQKETGLQFTLNPYPAIADDYGVCVCVCVCVHGVTCSGEMMLRFMGWEDAADLIITGMDSVIRQRMVTYDFERQMEGSGATIVRPSPCLCVVYARVIMTDASHDGLQRHIESVWCVCVCVCVCCARACVCVCVCVWCSADEPTWSASSQ